jgi:hypothetical protein
MGGSGAIIVVLADGERRSLEQVPTRENGHESGFISNNLSTGRGLVKYEQIIDLFYVVMEWFQCNII